ncbi:ABC transporter substrate-binding protein [Metabacillus iocasae]|uniref:Iron complex transport system substrate-binding protein n=1 Tax=Priestia iocasae TaxID=2291674 RepID=A0ABS2QXA2_9BACI|nr:ABC transporter substrate-binding protein [Metabacillus iocasae]MBM7703803.1 iron complex transport system substrate-binding protein [Metabacillus iocasae]
MKKQFSIGSLLLMIMMSILIGCTNEKPVSQSKESNTIVEETSAFPVTLTDDVGEEVIIEQKPERIVSLLPSTTEIIFSLGLDKEVVGVSDYCNYPEATEKLEKVGAQQMNLEKILELSPDLILLQDYHYTNSLDSVKQLKDAGINVMIIKSGQSFEDVYESISLLGKATGQTEEANEVVGKMKQEMDEMKEKAKAITEEKKVWVEVSPQPDIFTTGTNTFMHEMLETIQAENVAGDQEGWIKMNEEQAVSLNPDVIITTYGYYIENPEQQVYSRQGWAEVPAVKNKQVFDVNNDTVTRPGPRLVEGVETLGKLIYPDVFTE